MNIFDEKINLGPVFKMYFKNWKIIVITVLVCTLISILFTLQLTKRYQAKSSFFIPYTISYDQAIENPQFGYDIEADRLLQILNSELLKDSVIKKFDLKNYYDIDTTNFAWQDELSKIYYKRVYCNRTNAMSIVITAETHDPYFSAKIVKYIVELSQRMREKLLKTNSVIAVDNFEKDYLNKKNEVDSISKKIIELRSGAGAQSISLVNSQILMSVVNSGNAKSASISVELEILTQRYINEHNRLNDLKGRYERALSLLNRPLTQFYMLDEATPMFGKVFPIIWFNIALAFFASLFFIITALYIQYLFKLINNR